MAKKRANQTQPPTGAPKRPKKKSGKTQNSTPSPNRDPLGKLVKSYGVNWAEVVVASGILALLGGGVVIYALSGDSVSTLWLIVGAGFILMALAFVVYNALNIGRRLEVRKRGIRFTESGETTEFAWDEIVEVQIDRRDETNAGLVSIHKRSSDGVSSSGPLTKTEWDITIFNRDNRTIRLTNTFLRIVPDPQKLISQLRLGAGIR
ncbi:MAG: MgtC/SapB family protein [Planctomycetaceae bacterium]|nr:MgtC/SapB family protein [Planctomycetaceae bacterium]